VQMGLDEGLLDRVGSLIQATGRGSEGSHEPGKLGPEDQLQLALVDHSPASFHPLYTPEESRRFTWPMISLGPEIQTERVPPR
jgi:hypothetical protein